MSQESLQLFPLRVASFRPNPWGGKDSGDLVVTHDGHEFVTKWNHAIAGVAASEWLGCKLAQACHIAVPFTTVIADEQGRTGFGSRVEGAHRQWGAMPSEEKLAALMTCRQTISATLALDYFVCNQDRHLNNWVFRKNTTDQWTPLCIDYSRALFAVRWPSLTQLPTHCHTTTTHGQAKALQIWDGPFAVFAVQSIQEISRTTVVRWLDDCPPHWLADTEKELVAQWWGSERYHAHLQRVLQLL